LPTSALLQKYEDKDTPRHDHANHYLFYREFDIVSQKDSKAIPSGRRGSLTSAAYATYPLTATAAALKDKIIARGGRQRSVEGREALLKMREDRKKKLERMSDPTLGGIVDRSVTF
jgi:hypothetical protein